MQLRSRVSIFILLYASVNNCFAQQAEDVIAIETLPEPTAVENAERSDSELRASVQPSDAYARRPDRVPVRSAFSGGESLYEALARGPVHEAFAVPDPNSDMADFVVVSEAPPPPVQEVPPSPVPSGHNVQWVRGYWFWHEEAREYVWVTGFYRDAPPGRKWIVGSWSPTNFGHRWTPGYWSEEAKPILSALEAPPSSPPADAHVSSERPTPIPSKARTSFWISGLWELTEQGFQWRDGYWTSRYDNWLWVPARFVSTPKGHVYVSGYWDYEPPFRGKLFAPVAFRNPALEEPNLYLSPQIPVGEAAAVVLHMFSLPGAQQYYYGNYYTNRYTALGYRPWYADDIADSSAHMLDYYEWKYSRAGVSFTRGMHDFYRFLRETPSARPSPRTTVQPPLASEPTLLASPESIATLDAVMRLRSDFSSALRGRAGTEFSGIAGTDRGAVGRVAPASFGAAPGNQQRTTLPDALYRGANPYDAAQTRAQSTQLQRSANNPPTDRAGQTVNRTPAGIPGQANPAGPTPAADPRFSRRPILSRILQAAGGMPPYGPRPPQRAFPNLLSPPGLVPPRPLLAPPALAPAAPGYSAPGYSGRVRIFGGRRGR